MGFAVQLLVSLSQKKVRRLLRRLKSDYEVNSLGRFKDERNSSRYFRPCDQFAFWGDLRVDWLKKMCRLLRRLKLITKWIFIEDLKIAGNILGLLDHVGQFPFLGRFEELSGVRYYDGCLLILLYGYWSFGMLE